MLPPARGARPKCLLPSGRGGATRGGGSTWGEVWARRGVIDVVSTRPESREPRIQLLRGPRPSIPAPDLDPQQRAAVAHRGGPLRLLGAPGTGVTTTLVEAVVDRVERGELTPDQVLVLAPTRLA